MPLRIIAGAFRGRRLAAPPGETTRPTAERLRQSIFDMLMHAPWAGRAWLAEASVLDAFAGTGAMGLEALSRGAARAVFMDSDASALAALHANVAACAAQDRARILAANVLRPPRGEASGLVFLDPPYGKGLLPRAVQALRESSWIVSGTVVVAEASRLDEGWFNGVKLAQRVHGAGAVNVWREP